MLKHVNGNIQLFNNKYLERLLITPTLPHDSLIVQTVVVDDEILEHADVLYKNHKALGWRPYSYKCKHCDAKVTRSSDKFITHLSVCKGLDD